MTDHKIELGETIGIKQSFGNEAPKPKTFHNELMVLTVNFALVPRIFEDFFEEYDKGDEAKALVRLQTKVHQLEFIFHELLKDPEYKQFVEKVFSRFDEERKKHERKED